MADDGPTASTSPSQQVIDGYRSTAKWIIGGFAAVGAALAGTSVFGNLGQLSYHSDLGRLVIAGAAAAAGVVSILVAVFAVAKVLAPAQVTLPGLVKDKPGRLNELVELDPNLDMSLDEFGRGYSKRLGAYNTAKANAAKESNDKAEESETAARDALADLTDPVNTIIGLGLAETVGKSFEDMKYWVGGCAVVAGVALATFAWAANPPSPNTATTTTSTTITKVSGRTTTATQTSTTTPTATAP